MSDRNYYLLHKHALGQTAGPYTLHAAGEHADHDPDAYTLLREVHWDDSENLTEALHNAVAALNRNGFVTRSAALYDLAEAVTRHLGLEWNPYGQTRHPDGTITRKDEDIKP